ncbi:sarcosine oxidase subunit gamma [Roseibacterium sp. SDUM158016]|uniref:sarcosine oxidase subunit gamma n=1 Tax=Roseicyclus sediminis TaxID=2980997 RepID=UPI0021D2F2D7|nr:sarcosine oxidase subunit gamma family protein [Roseibacterium sp. SDUM158016]MCU4651834.1 sarcosine oxidase subunit gamma [Roseibacterium sp. SDUM158016]
MSDLARSALPGAEAGGIVSVREMGLQGMVTLRADLSVAAKALKKVTGAAMPEVRGMTEGEGTRVAWMSPDELLILCDHSAAGEMARGLTEALKGQHHLAVDVSDARAMFSLTGEAGALRDVLAKVTPADLAALAPGEMRRTRLQQVAAALWFESGTEARVVCFRSVAQYVFDLLALSAKDGGAVGYH